MAEVTFDGIGKVYPNGWEAVTGLDLEIADGEFVVLVGPSGCGKTTALRMAAGLETITSGELRIGGEVVNNVEPRKRDVAMVFQNYALYPHMTVRENIAFPLRASGVDRAEIAQRVEKTAQLLGIEDQLRRRPGTLSGGQRQRVAMGRAIVREPRVFLMDEPLSNLDAKLRVQMRGEIARLQQTLGTTTLYVTHDQVEAMTMGDRIVVMRKGVLQQQGAAQDVYDWPANIFVATFLGSPGMNLFRARLEASDGQLSAVIGEQRLALGGEGRYGDAIRAYVGAEIVIGIRPEDVVDAGSSTDMPLLRGAVQHVEALGAEQLVYVRVAAEPVMTDEVREVAQDVDVAAVEMLELEARSHETTVVARFGRGGIPRTDETIEVGIDLDRVRFFDLQTGVAVDGDPQRAQSVARDAAGLR